MMINSSRIKQAFVRGIVFLVPVCVAWLTLVIIINVLSYIWALLPIYVRLSYWVSMSLWWLDVVLLVLMVILIGWLSTLRRGQWMISRIEKIIDMIPLVRSMYTGVKEGMVLLTSSKAAFKQVVLVEYPRRGCWSVAFLTNESAEPQSQTQVQNLLSVFVPTTPNPTSGYILILPRKQVKYLNMSVEDALKFVISLGASGGAVFTECNQQDIHSHNKEN